MKKYICVTCDYTAKTKTNLNIHNKSKKHLDKCECEVNSQILEVNTPINTLINLPINSSINNYEEINKKLTEKNADLLEINSRLIEEINNLKNELKIKDVIICCEREKNELILKLLSQPIQKVYEPIQPIEEPKNKCKFELLTSQDPKQESKEEPKQEPKQEKEPDSPKGKKFKCLKDFIEKKCKITDNTWKGFMTKIKEKVSPNDINLLCSGRVNKIDYMFKTITEVFESYDKYEKPFYNNDKYHKNMYCEKDGKFNKEDIGETVGAIYTHLFRIIMSKAYEMKKIYKYEEMYSDDEIKEMEESTGKDIIIDSFVETKEFRNIDPTGYDDYDVLIEKLTERFIEIIYINNDDIN